MNNFYNDFDDNLLFNIIINKGSHVDPYVRIPERYRRNNYDVYKAIGCIYLK